jgi:hypothetical protein
MTSVLRDLDPRTLDRAPTSLCLTQVKAVRPDQLTLRTPCDEWNLGELVAHLLAENRGFASNASGVIDRVAWQPGPPDEVVLAEFPASVDQVTRAFADDEVLDRQVEVREFGVFPGRVAAARPAGGAFAAVVLVAHEAGPVERLLGLVGRDPEWGAR